MPLETCNLEQNLIESYHQKYKRIIKQFSEIKTDSIMQESLNAARCLAQLELLKTEAECH